MLESEVEKRTMPDFVKPLADGEVIEGKEALLKCKVAGLPYPTISWYHNGKQIESSEERRMTQCKQRPQSGTSLGVVEAVSNKCASALQTGMSTVWSFGAPVTLMAASTRPSSPIKWAKQPATHIYTSQVETAVCCLMLQLRPLSYAYTHSFMALKTDIVPDAPDGPPVIEAITGKTISLSWKRPKRLDPSFGEFIRSL